MNRKRLSDYGIRVGCMPTGPLDKITDVPGVTVGHATVRDARHHTGVTVIMPCEDNMFAKKLTAASFVLNGFGKTAGLMQIEELGSIETPIALTNTLNVGLVSDALVQYTIDRCGQDGIDVQSVNPIVCECNDGGLSDIRHRAVGYEQVMQAIRSAGRDFEQGCVGAGTGTVCHSLKGGIGSASRCISAGRTMCWARWCRPTTGIWMICASTGSPWGVRSATASSSRRWTRAPASSSSAPTCRCPTGSSSAC